MTFSSRTVTLAATATATIASALAYPFLPKRVATHTDLDGHPDRYGSRVAAALTMPAVMAGMQFANDRLASWPGGNDREDRDSGVRARNESIAVLELAFLSIHLSTLARGLALLSDTGRIERCIYGCMMIGLGNVMPKLPRNSVVGIRTPWTLADPGVWERTHRLGGYLCTAAGVFSLLSLPMSGKRAARIPRVATLGAVAISAAYSFVAYARRTR